MIHHNNKDIIGIYQHGRVITAVYYGAVLVWQLANSCFGSGIWLRDKKWSNSDGWRNN